MKYPQFENAIKEKIVDPTLLSRQRPGYGIVFQYYPASNTADVLSARPGSDQMGQTYTNVPCPTTLGIQGVGPEPGRPCWLGFRDGVNKRNPIILSFFNPDFDQIDSDRQNYAINDMPRFLGR